MISGLLEQNHKSVLGLNRRNQLYVRPLNSNTAKNISDNKLLTKRVLAKIGIKTPELYKVIRNKQQLEHIDWTTLPKSFVIKPNRGSVGSGILVFFGKRKGKMEWIRPNGSTMDTKQMEIHMEKILEGRFSMGNRTDIVLIEERIRNASALKKYCYKGVPDIRLIVYNRVPVMAMVRLPTKRSDGKANLHAGGICAGIDIASGLTTFAMHNKPKSLFDDTYEMITETTDLSPNQELRGIKIPYWDEILEISIKCQDASGLGYMGVDIVIDQEHGPMVLEMNARPGLGIQFANSAGLRDRLERVEGLKIKSIKHGVRVAKNLFGGEVEESIVSMSGKTVVNLVEKVNIYYNGKKKKNENVSALLDTGVLTSRIDRGLASRVGYSSAMKEFESHGVPKFFAEIDDAKEYIKENEPKFLLHPQIKRLARVVESGRIRVRPVIEIDLKIAGERKTIDAIVSTQKDMIYPVLVGRRILKDYLIDAGKTFTK